MREIKFRAWNKKDQKFLHDKHGASHNLGFWNKVIKSGFYDFQQYTGLKDRKGKEIYEGDILKSDKDRPFQLTGKVVWKNYGWWLCIPSKNIPVDEPLVMFEKGEVIGNTYENPELLEESK